MPQSPDDFTLDHARAIAVLAHDGQFDKLGVPYIEHVEAVAQGLADQDLEVRIAGMLHDVVEDSDLTIEDLRLRGVPERALAAVELVTHDDSRSYDETIARISASLDATLVKISDNAHNSRPDRVAALEASGRSSNPRYQRARVVLYAAAPRRQVTEILTRVAPELLVELPPQA